MRVRFAAALLTLVVGCGKFLGLDEDETVNPSPVATVDASDRTAEDASSSTGSADASGSDGARAYAWSCGAQSMGLVAYPDEMACNTARLGTSCSPTEVNPPPNNGDSCTAPEPGTIAEPQQYCDACQKDVTGGYNFAVKTCICQAE